MPRCSICAHPDRVAIDKALTSGTSLRDIAGQYSLSRSAVDRHKRNCLLEQLARAERVVRARKPRPKPANPEAEKAAVAIVERQDAEALDVMTELKNIFVRMNKLLNACDTWLTDPDDPTRYDLSPRAHEVMVHYEEVDNSGPRPVVLKRKATLEKLLGEAKGETARSWTLVETKSADPRDLIVKSAGALRGQTTLLAKLIGQLDERPQINFLVMPEWQALRSEIVKALRPYPEAKAAVVGRLLALKAGGDE